MKLSDLISEYYESEALKIRYRLKELDASYYIFERNYGELIKLLTHVRQPVIYQKLWNDKNRLDMILLELTRLLYNFIDSAMSLVAHIRNFINAHYKGTDFYKKYDKEKAKRFVNNPTAGFVQDLRNYTQHYRLPITGTHFEIEVDPKTQEISSFTNPITLDKARLLEWENWTQEHGKPYLDAADDRIDVQVVVVEYARAVRDFKQWIMNNLQKFHADELKWLKETEREIRKARGNPPRPSQ